jgi:preprotein translocase subunit SecE
MKDTKGEMKHVNWPTRKQTIAYTSLVIIISIAIAIDLGIFDFIFTKGIALLSN